MVWFILVFMSAEDFVFDSVRFKEVTFDILDKDFQGTSLYDFFVVVRQYLGGVYVDFFDGILSELKGESDFVKMRDYLVFEILKVLGANEGNLVRARSSQDLKRIEMCELVEELFLRLSEFLVSFEGRIRVS